MLKPLLLTGVLATTARATADFPSQIQAKYSLAQPPTCALCHRNDQDTHYGTVTKPFGVALRQRGLLAYDTASLVAALDRLQADGVDSDGDGVADVAELMAGTNPNFPPGVEPPIEPAPTYGCSASGLFPLAFGALLLLRRR